MQDAMTGLRFWQNRPGVTYLLLHGFAGGHDSWAHVIAHLHSGSIVTATLPGHGAGALVRDGGFDGYVNWLCEVIDAIGARHLHLAGYSAGGRVVAGALTRGVVCSSASLVSASLGAISAAEREVRRGVDRQWSTLLRTRGIRAFVEGWEAQPIFASQASLPVAVQAQQRALRLAHDPNALADAMDALSVAGMPDLSTQLTGRVQMIIGARDAKYVELARARDLPVVTLADCGHNPLIEAPEALALALENFAIEAATHPSH